MVEETKDEEDKKEKKEKEMKNKLGLSCTKLSTDCACYPLQEQVYQKYEWLISKRNSEIQKFSTPQ